MQQAMMQALQSLGLAVPGQPQATSGSSPTSPSSTSTDSDGDSDGSTAATGSIKKDLRQFMHALFQAVKSESSATSGNGTSASTDPKANFAAGLTALISQVSNGSAPSDLQSAFTQLTSDLQAAGSAATATTTSATSAATTSLQALLTELQKNIGYGSSTLSPVGNLLNQTA
jgi:hypothetical protein